MPLAEDNDMVKAIPSDRPDEPLRMSVLPWRSWCDRPVPTFLLGDGYQAKMMGEVELYDPKERGIEIVETEKYLLEDALRRSAPVPMR